jgi:two-component system chemotaxis sensor kinase CheA
MAIDMSKYLGLFVQEATEHLEAFGQDLVRLEREGHQKDVVDALFRHAHSVKGMSASMGFTALTNLAHRAEDLVDRIRCRPEALTPELVDVLLATGDRLAEGVRRAGEGLPAPEAADLEEQLARAIEAAGGEPRPAPPPARPEAKPLALPGATPATVRIRTELLDGFLEAVGELILATSRLRELGRSLPDRERPAVEEGVDALARIVKELQGQVMAVRMTPVSLVTDPLPRAARDLARQLGRDLEVTVEGADIELDRSILEALRDPLLHLWRNAVDHGIEPPEERVAAGKPPRGLLALRVRRERDRVVVEIEDDGRGMEPDRLRAAAVRRGLLAADAARALSTRDALQLAFLPGLSTARTISDLSGRGVGLDAAKRQVEAVGGTIDLTSTPGRGTCFVLRLPLTIAVVPLLLVGVGDELFGLPIAKVLGAVEAGPADLVPDAGLPTLRHGGRSVPVYRLASLLDLPASGGAAVRPHVVVEGDGSHLVALGVDRLVGQEEAVLKPVPAPLDRLPGFLGVTILGTGRPLFVLDVPRLLAA